MLYAASLRVRVGMAGQDERMNAHAPHLSAAGMDQPTSVSVWERPAVSSHGRTNRLSQIPAEGGPDFGLICLLVHPRSPYGYPAVCSKGSAQKATILSQKMFVLLKAGKRQRKR